MQTAQSADLRQLLQSVESSVLCRMRYIDHAGHDHMLMIGIIDVVVQQSSDLLGCYLAVMVRQRQHLVPAEFDSPRLMCADMPRLSADYALIAAQECVDHSRIGLRAAYQKENIRVRGAACLAYPGLGRVAIDIKPVSGSVLHVGIGEALKDTRVRALHIVAGKIQMPVHRIDPLHFIKQSEHRDAEHRDGDHEIVSAAELLLEYQAAPDN